MGHVLGSIWGGVRKALPAIAGGIMGANEARQYGNQLSQTANPFGQYNQQFANLLASQSGPGKRYGDINTIGEDQLANYVNQNSLPMAEKLGGWTFADKLNKLVSDPSSVFSSPLYQAAFSQGKDAVNSTLAAQGLSASGNQLAALQKYGMTFGEDFYNKELSQLSGLYGQALGANQQGYDQLTGMVNHQMLSNQQGFNQLAQLSGLSSGSPSTAAQFQSQVPGQVAEAYGNVGQGLGQIASSFGNILGSLRGGSGGSMSSLFGPSGGGNVFDGYTYGGNNSFRFHG
jgi:hypothetical protein